MFQFFGIIIIIFGVINLVRMTVLLIGADLYNVHFHFKRRKLKNNSYPTISIVIPAFNEEKTILRCIDSIFTLDYPAAKIEVIVVDDGSTDTTGEKVINYKKSHRLNNLSLVSQGHIGKAEALNLGMKNYTKGQLVMCLDADSYLTEQSLKNVARHFYDKNVVALATNVKIAKSRGVLNLVQTFEYIVCHQMKRAQTFFNIEYIIGGIGSTFRKELLEKLDYYDANTVTEDIDLTMKILKGGNKRNRIVYASDVITYTQGALTLADLIKQRSRWKWGRYQTFYKNRSMFFTREKTFTKGLTWIYLPFAVWCDATFLLEPLVISYIIAISIVYKDPFTLISAIGVLTFYLTMNIVAETTMSFKEKIKLVLLAPFMYFLFYLLSFVEYIALIRSLLNLPNLSHSLTSASHPWQPIRREGYFGKTSLVES